MPETAPAQVQRLIELIAWMSQRDTNTSIPYRAAAKHLGVSKETVRRDLDALVGLSDEFKPWLASLSVGDGYQTACTVPCGTSLKSHHSDSGPEIISRLSYRMPSRITRQG